MAVCSSTEIARILMAGLRRTPEERDRLNAEARAEIARRGAIERARYEAMSERERDEYDAETDGMMPRLRGAAERMAERAYRARERGDT